MGDTGPRRVAINAQLSPRLGSGGAAYALGALIHALGKLQDGPEEYVVVGPRSGAEWLDPYLGPNAKLVVRPTPARPDSSLKGWLKARLRSAVQAPATYPGTVPISDGFYESLGCGVLHFAHQAFEIAAMPSVYCPHDLQHLHYPQFFTASTLAQRETVYPAGCHFAQTVVVPAQWVKDDVRENYRVSGEKIQVIPWAPPSSTYPAPDAQAIERTRIKYKLDQPFAFYPAIPWPHKNHSRLFEALSLLSKRGEERLRLVCSGSEDHLWQAAKQKAASLGLQDRILFLGEVEPVELRAIYRLAEFVISPSLFEGGAMPMLECWLEGTALACSNATMMPEQAGDAALLFDPHSAEAIAEAMLKLRTSERLRNDLAGRGAERVRNFTWERTAKAYRAVFRRAAGWPLTEEDRTILNWNWATEPAGTRL